MEEQLILNTKQPLLIVKKKAKHLIEPQDKPLVKFWNNTSGTYRIDPESLHEFLNERGYRTYKPAGVRTTILIKIENNRVREVTSDEIWKLCWNYIDSEYQFTDIDERKKVKDVFHRSRSLFHKQNLSLLKTINLNECKDAKDKSFIFFNDCILEITVNSIVVKDYSEIEGIVIESDICPFNLKPYFQPETKTLEGIFPEGEFCEFVQDLCRNGNQAVVSKNLESLVTIIGYLVHRHKDPANAKAIILMDTYSDGTPNGGTGKGILTKGIGKIRESVFQDGKLFSSSDKFTYSNVQYGTRTLILDDVPEKFSFEKIFPLITEKIVIERKYENKFVIPFEESPKVIITTNYTVEGTSGSHRRRKVEFILSETFNADYTPEDKFGHLLFTEWPDEEWYKFYLFMCYCVQEFLKKSIVLPAFNVSLRKLKMETTPEFIEFAQSIETLVKHNKKVVYENFYSRYPNHHKVEMTTFRNWLKYVADAFRLKFMESHSGSDSFFEFSE